MERVRRGTGNATGTKELLYNSLEYADLRGPEARKTFTGFQAKLILSIPLQTAFLNFLARTMKIQRLCFKDKQPMSSFFYFEKVLT